MAIGDDFSVALNGDIRHVAGTTTYTVLELHRWLMDLADDQQASGNDLVDIITYTPSERATDQIITLLDYSGVSGPTFNIDNTAAEFLYDGSVTQRGGDEQYSGLVMVGSVPAGTEIQVIQNEAIYTSFWGTGLNAVPASNILNQVLILTRTNGANIDGKKVLVVARELGDSYAEFSATLGQANSTAAIFTASDLNNQTVAGTISGWTIINTEGYQTLDIPADGSADPFYSQWDKGTQSNNDLYEYTKWIQRRGTSETIHGLNGFLFRGITHSILYDGEAGTGPVENDLAVWGTTFNYGTELASGLTVGEYYTFQTSGAVGKLLALDDNGATGSVVFAIEPGSGTVVNTEAFIRSDGTATDGASVASVPADTTAVGGRGLILADNATNTIWIQLLSGSAPVNNLPMYNVALAGTYNVADTFVVDTTVTSRTVSPAFLGQSTGSNIIGAYGIGVKPSEAVVGDSYTDLGSQLVQPPNNVTFSVGGLISGEDRVLVTNANAGGIDFAQFTLNTTLSGATETAVVMGAAIPTDTPSSGVIRIELDSPAIYRYQAYTSWTGSTFTIASTSYTGANQATAGNNVFIGYIDKLAAAATESFTVVYNTDRTMFVRVRDGGTAGDLTGIKTFQATAVLGSSGGGLNAIRTSDA
jgi:hypothetical protein